MISNDINFYIKYFEDIYNGDYNRFLTEMEKNLKDEKSRNNVLDIKGIDDKINGEEGR